MSLKQESKLVQAHIKEVVAGKSSAFEQLYITHSERIYNFALKIFEQDKSAAEELTQKVFINAFEKINSYPENITFILWLRRMSVAEMLKNGITKSVDSHHASNVDQAIFALPLEERIVFILNDVEKLSPEEIAVITKGYMADINLKLENARNFLMQKLESNADDLDYKVNFVSQKHEPGSIVWNSIYNVIHGIATKDFKEDKTDDQVLNAGEAEKTKVEKQKKFKKAKKDDYISDREAISTKTMVYIILYGGISLGVLLYLIFF